MNPDPDDIAKTIEFTENSIREGLVGLVGVSTSSSSLHLTPSTATGNTIQVGESGSVNIMMPLEPGVYFPPVRESQLGDLTFDAVMPGTVIDWESREPSPWAVRDFMGLDLNPGNLHVRYIEPITVTFDEDTKEFGLQKGEHRLNLSEMSKKIDKIHEMLEALFSHSRRERVMGRRTTIEDEE